MTSKIAGEPHTPREKAVAASYEAGIERNDLVVETRQPLQIFADQYWIEAGSPVACISTPPTDIISAPPAASRQSSEPAPSRASCPSPPCVVHASSGPSGCAPTPRTCVGQCWRPHASCTSRRPSLVPCKACPSWCVRHIAARLEPRAALFANWATPAWVFSATSKSSLPLPLPHLRCRLDIANNCLTTLMDDHALDPDDLRAFASLPIQRVEHVGHAPGKVRAILPQLRRHFGRLIVHHSPAKALHGAKVHRHRLRGQHAFDFVGRLERPQGRDRGEHLLTASFVCLARRKPSGSGHRVDQHAIKLVAPRSAECAQFVGFGFVDEDVSRGGLLFFQHRWRDSSAAPFHLWPGSSEGLPHGMT